MHATLGLFITNTRAIYHYYCCYNYHYNYHYCYCY